MTIFDLGTREWGAAPEAIAPSRAHIVGGRSPAAIELVDVSRDLADLETCETWWEGSIIDPHDVAEVLHEHGLQMGWDDIERMAELWPSPNMAQHADLRETLMLSAVVEAEPFS